MTITELIALLAKAPQGIQWYVQNRTLTSAQYKAKVRLVGIGLNLGLNLGKCYQLHALLDGDINYITLTKSAYALLEILEGANEIIIKDAKEVFYAISAEEVKDYDISNLVNG